MGRLISKVVRWTWLVPAALVLACLPLLAATFANNSATVVAPAGVIDAVGGCNTNSPPDCTGNNASSATVNVWATTVAKSSTPANGSTVLAGHGPARPRLPERELRGHTDDEHGDRCQEQ